MIDTAALREKVLDLAIRGKLVPQDPNDEPASVLLERIHEQKLQMVREGKLKAKDVKDDTIIFKGDDNCYYEKYSDESVKNIQGEIPFELPAGWAWSRLKSIVIKEIKRGKAPIYADKSSVLVFAQKCNVKHCGINMQLAKYLNEAVLKKYTAEDFLFIDDVIINSTGTGTLGRVGILSKECFNPVAKIVPDTHITVVRTHKEIVSSYIFFMLKHMQPKLEISGEGSTNQKELRPDYIKNLLCPIPPIGEQLKIVDVITESNEALKVIDTKEFEISDAIASLKSKILELAIQGKLVPQDENDEPASVLLERIRAERKAKLGKKYIESFIYKGDDNCYYENNDNNPIETPYNLPENWVFSRLEEVVWLEDGIRSSGEELPYLDVKTIRGKQNATILSSGKIIEKGMQVILVDGENSGEVFEVPCRGYMGSTFRILKVSSYVEIDYIRLILDYYKNLFKDNKTGSAIPHLNKKIFKSLIIGIPPIEEQKAIENHVKSAVNILKDEV